jgi:hypothetical protein
MPSGARAVHVQPALFRALGKACPIHVHADIGLPELFKRRSKESIVIRRRD